MAMSLAFHIGFAAIGMAMPLLMVLAEGWYARSGDPIALKLARKWSKGVSVLFAVGAVSGTVLSFELGLLWPSFMAVAGPVIGMPFSMEGFAFFLEAIFLGIYMYGWDRVSRPLHLFAGSMVCVSGVLSGAFVICANGWMNTPAGFRWQDGHAVNIDPWGAMFNPSAIPEGIHMIAAAFAAVGFMVAGIHARMLLKDPASAFHRLALGIALLVAVPGAVLTPATAHFTAQAVARNQPIKLAAMEAHWDTEAWAPFRIGGWPDEVDHVTRYAIDIPGLLSLLAYDDPRATVRGLNDFPADERPPILPVHLAFQLMVGCGMIMVAVGGVAAVLAVRTRGVPTDPRLLKAIVLCTPLGLVAIEAGWTVTEVGRQPWIINGLVRTADAVTPATGLWIHFGVFAVLYAALGAVVIATIRHMVSETGPEAHP